MHLEHIPSRPDVPVWGMSQQDVNSPGVSLPPLDGEFTRLSGRRILVVEDEVMIALELEMLLEDEGVEVIGPAATLEDALRVFTEQPHIDAAILDIDLNGEKVFPLAQKLRDAGIAFVFHTAHGGLDEVRDDFGDVPVCHKPTISNVLIDELSALVNAD